LQVATGLELDANDVIQPLPSAGWRARRDQLSALSGKK
jgi:hypothetical protein